MCPYLALSRSSPFLSKSLPLSIAEPLLYKKKENWQISTNLSARPMRADDYIRNSLYDIYTVYYFVIARAQKKSYHKHSHIQSPNATKGRTPNTPVHPRQIHTCTSPRSPQLPHSRRVSKKAPKEKQTRHTWFGHHHNVKNEKTASNDTERTQTMHTNAVEPNSDLL